MSAPLKVLAGEDAQRRARRDQSLQDTLAALWRGKGAIFASLSAALLVSVIALVLTPPRYTGEAIIRFSFDGQETAAAGAKAQPIATLDPAALVDGAARIIRSRAVASAVVTRLGLDRDPRFTHDSRLMRSLTAMRSALRLQQPVAGPSPHELAVATLMSQVAVTNEPRSYLITIDATAVDPKRAADFANAVALEYLRSEVIQRLNEARVGAEQDLDELASIYGIRHPNYLRGQERLEQLKANLEAARQNGELTALLDSEIGPSLIPADVVAIPSSPNPRIIIGLAALIGLAIGAWLALRPPGAAAVALRDAHRGEPAEPRESRRARSR